MLKVDNTTGDIIKTLKLEQYKINSNNTINSVYRNKQVDFFVVSDDQEFALVQFYKSYSGFGAYLGLFLDSKEVKLSETGLYCV